MASTLTRTQSATPSVRISDPFTAMRMEMSDWLSNIWGGNGNGEGVALFRGGVAPALDVAEKDNSFEIRMDIPGVDSKDLDVEVHGNTVTISGSRKEERGEGQDVSSSGTFLRLLLANGHAAMRSQRERSCGGVYKRSSLRRSAKVRRGAAKEGCDQSLVFHRSSIFGWPPVNVKNTGG